MVEDVVFGGAVKASRSLLCHQIGIPSPQYTYGDSVMVDVPAEPATRIVFDRPGAT